MPSCTMSVLLDRSHLDCFQAVAFCLLVEGALSLGTAKGVRIVYRSGPPSSACRREAGGKAWGRVSVIWLSCPSALAAVSSSLGARASLVGIVRPMPLLEVCN